MKAGKILHRFTAKDGQEVTLRTPKWEDLDDFMEYINSLVEEGVGVQEEHVDARHRRHARDNGLDEDRVNTAVQPIARERNPGHA